MAFLWRKGSNRRNISKMETTSLNRQVDTSLIILLLKAALSSTGESNIVQCLQVIEQVPDCFLPAAKMAISSGQPGSGRELSCRGKQQSLAHQVQSNPQYSCSLSYIYHVFCRSQGFHSYKVEYDTLILTLPSL
jgi:hypothetical protein